MSTVEIYPAPQPEPRRSSRLYAAPDGSPFGSVRGAALVALGSGLVAGWSWQYGLVPAMRGPIAVAMGGTDFSRFSGALVAGGLYWLLARRGCDGAGPPTRSAPAGRGSVLS